MKIMLFTHCAENKPMSYVDPATGSIVFAAVGIASAHPVAEEKRLEIKKIVVAIEGEGWEADVVALLPCCHPEGKGLCDIFYRNARKLDGVPERTRGPGRIRYADESPNDNGKEQESGRTQGTASQSMT
jgi:hypothetical protein